MSDRQERCIQSVVKAMALLDCLAAHRRPMALGELAAALGAPKASVHGLLASLRQNGTVEQSPADGKYRLGIRLFEYGCVVSSSWDVVGCSREPMRHIALESGDSSVLSTLEGDSALTIEAVAAAGSFRVVSETGDRMPLHCTAQGKLLTASLPAGERRSLLQRLRFPAYTPHTITAPEALERELAAIRERGYATEDGEYRIGLRGVSAPIRDVTGRVCAAIGIVGMFRRVHSEEFERARDLVVAAAGEISYAMGSRSAGRD